MVDEKLINRATAEKQAKLKRRANKDGDHDHGHGHGGLNILTAVAAGTINFFLMFGLCSAYGMIMFNDEWNETHRGLGVKMNLCTAFVMGILLSLRSKVGVAVGGPDLNPVVFLAGFISVMSKEIADDLGLEYPTARRLTEDYDTALDVGYRLLGGASESTAQFCVGEHLLANTVECNDYHEQLRATTIFATSFATCCACILYLTLGKLNWTRYVSYVPTNIMEAFLSCIGFKVFKYALKFCKFDAKQFVPAACVGVPLYFLKQQHVGNPAIVMLLGLLVPLGCFYAIVYGSGSDVDQARKDDLMFPLLKNVDFWQIWTDSIGNASQIKFKAWTKTLPDLALMMIVCVLDNLLKLSASENKLPVTVDKDYEIKLHGLGNIGLMLCGSSVGYMQLKFNVIAYGVMGNAKDRRAGIVLATACGICFFWAIDLANYMPRFFLSALLFFAGAGFVAENLWESRKYLSFAEWMQVLVILGVFIFTSSLIHAVIVGGLMVGSMFIAKYAKVPCVVGEPTRGGEINSCQRLMPMLHSHLIRISYHWVYVIKLKGFVFFASAENLVTHLRATALNNNRSKAKIRAGRGTGLAPAGGFIMDEQEEDEHEETKQARECHEKCRYIIFDCEQLDGMDSSAGKTLARFIKDAKAIGVHIFWTGADEELKEGLKKFPASGGFTDFFDSLDEALICLEDEVQEYREKQQETWANIHPAFQLAQEFQRQNLTFNPFGSILGPLDLHFGNPWSYCKPVKTKAFRTVLWQPNEANVDLFLVHTGAVALYEKSPDQFQDHTMPIAIYKAGWFLNREVLFRFATRYHAVAIESGELVAWSRRDWLRMERDQPIMAARLQQEVMAQLASDMERLSSTLEQNSDHQASLEEMLDNFASRNDPKSQLSRAVTGDLQDPSAQTMRGSILSSLSVASRKSMGNDEVDDFGMLRITHDCNDSINCALYLELLGMYDPIDKSVDGEGVLPKLFGHIEWCLEQSFNLFAEETEDGGRKIPARQVNYAFMFAGIFNSLLLVSEIEDLDYKQFKAVGHEASMMRLSEKQLATIKDVFGSGDLDGSNELSIDELLLLMHRLYGSELTVDECVALMEPWTNENHKVDLKGFTSFISRAARKHQMEWVLLRTVRDLWGVEKPCLADGLAEKGFVCPSREECGELKKYVQQKRQFLKDIADATKQIASSACTALAPSSISERLDIDQDTLRELLWASNCRQDSFKYGGRFLDDCSRIIAAAALYAHNVSGASGNTLPHGKISAVCDTLSQGIHTTSINLKKTKAAKSPSAGTPGTSETSSQGDGLRQRRLSGVPTVSVVPPTDLKALDPDKLAQTDLKKLDPEELARTVELLRAQLLEAERLQRQVVEKDQGSSTRAGSAVSADLMSENRSNRVLLPAAEHGTAAPLDEGGAKSAKKKKKTAKKNKALPIHEMSCPTPDAEADTMEPVQDSYQDEEQSKLDSVTADDPKDVSRLPKGSGIVVDPRSWPLDSFSKELFILCDLEGRKTERKRTVYSVASHIEIEVEEKNKTWANKLDDLMNDPLSSKPAMFLSAWLAVCISGSFIIMMLKPLICKTGEKGKSCRESQEFFIPEFAFCIVFTLEYFLRLLAAAGTHTACKFLKDPMNTFDILAVVPMYLALLFKNNDSKFLSNLRAVRFLKLLRIVRVMKLQKRFQQSTSGADNHSWCPKRLNNIWQPCCIVIMVIWAIYMKSSSDGDD